MNVPNWRIEPRSPALQADLYQLSYQGSPDCEMITTTELINISIASHRYHYYDILRTPKVYPLSKCQVCNAVSLTTVTMLHIRLPELFTCIAEILYLVTSIFPFPPALVTQKPPASFILVYGSAVLDVDFVYNFAEFVHSSNSFCWCLCGFIKYR